MIKLLRYLPDVCCGLWVALTQATARTALALALVSYPDVRNAELALARIGADRGSLRARAQ